MSKQERLELIRREVCVVEARRQQAIRNLLEANDDDDDDGYDEILCGVGPSFGDGGVAWTGRDQFGYCSIQVQARF